MNGHQLSTTTNRPTGSGHESTTGRATLPQLTLSEILVVWAAATVPMAVLFWVAAPLVAGRLAGPGALARSMVLAITLGLMWQFVLVLFLVRREQGSLRWTTVREALWLRAPRHPRTGRRGGRMWLILPVLIAGMGLREFMPQLPHPAALDFFTFMRSPAGEELLTGSWGWFAVLVVMSLFNTVLGEELLFRGYLLPRMEGTFGRWDWLANGILFAAYHVHRWWGLPGILLGTLLYSAPSKRYPQRARRHCRSQHAERRARRHGPSPRAARVRSPFLMNAESSPMMPFGRSIAAIILATASGGRHELAALLRGLTHVRTAPRWYVAAVVLPAGILAATFGVALTQGATAPLWDASHLVQLLATLATTVILVGLFEELGWRGFLLPLVQRRYGAVAGSIVVAMAWVPWHLPELISDASQRPVIQFVILLTAQCVLLAWLYNRTTGSLPVVILLHYPSSNELRPESLARPCRRSPP